MKTKLLSAFIFILGSFAVQANIIQVPADYPTIQAAVNASVNGDTVLVIPGVYNENINFRGKHIVVTSLYYVSGDTLYMTNTIIDGSTPLFPDTGSCVIFNHGEDSTTVLQGFTLTGGSGTKWLDIHGAGIFREGGGILCEQSSPLIMHNVIRNNVVTNMTGVTSTGGGGIRIGDSNPQLIGNLIMDNTARYGPGIVLNYTGCVIRNNIIVNNTGGQDYNGGSGIWILDNLGTTPKIIENNTICNNTSTLIGGTGGVLAWGALNVILRNNIIFGNTPALQIKSLSGGLLVNYNDVQGGYAGIANQNVNPLFTADSYFLSDSSFCIDNGDPDPLYNDVEDILTPGSALFPAHGSLRSDIGAYGGPYACLFPSFNGTSVGLNELGEHHSFHIYPNPAVNQITVTSLNKSVIQSITIIDITGHEVYRKELNTAIHTLNLKPDLTPGTYIVRLNKNKEQQKLIIQ